VSSRRALTVGDIVLVSFPYTDMSDSRVRPAHIIAGSSGGDWVFAFITSDVRSTQYPPEVLHAQTDPEFSLTGLRFPSLVQLDRLVTLNRDLVRRRLGRIGPHTTQTVKRVLRRVLDL
jgi:mRNA interferase MazF